MTSITGFASLREALSDIFSTGLATTDLSVTAIIVNHILALLLGLFIFITYRVSHTGEAYSGKFNVSLVMLTLVTTIVMCAINNNVSLSLGLVGALSIVRFRTAIRDSRDAIFIFWAVAVGICCGVSSYMIAIVGSIFVFGFLIILGMVKASNQVLIIVRGTAEGIQAAEKTIDQHYAHRATLRVNNVSATTGTGEIIFEIPASLKEKFDQRSGTIQSRFYGMDGIDSISVVRQEEDISQ